MIDRVRYKGIAIALALESCAMCICQRIVFSCKISTQNSESNTVTKNFSFACEEKCFHLYYNFINLKCK